MAEAVIVIDDDEETPQPTPGRSTGSKFFCHICKVELDEVSDEYTCPLCAKGFIEELPAASVPEPNDVEMAGDNAFFPFLPPAMNTRLSNEISSLLMSVTGGQYPTAGEDEATPPPPAANGAEPGVSRYVHIDNGIPLRPVPARAGRRRTRTQSTFQLADFDHIVQEFLVNVTGRGGAGGSQGGPMYFMANPQDYVFGREGLDTIVTQLLNQMDGTGPPPLNKDKIAEIPKVAVTKEQVDEKLQCSICWEDFQLEETVRKLPCVHIYHEMCIVPWLELHGTCPVCRQALSTDESEDGIQQRANDAVANSLRNVAAMYVPNSVLQGRPAVASTSTRRPQSARRGSRRRHYSDRSSGRAPSPGERRDEDGNIDYDFD